MSTQQQPALQFTDISEEGSLLKKIEVIRWDTDNPNIKHRIVFKSDLIVDGSNQAFRIPFEVQTIAFDGNDWQPVTDSQQNVVFRPFELNGNVNQNPAFAAMFSNNMLLNSIGNLILLYASAQGIIPQNENP